MIGRVLAGRYRVERKLGEGGMAEVFLVEHLELGRREALKVLHANLASTPDLVARFRREARATNRLSHKNIVALYDFGRLDDGRFFLTTELAEGEALDLRLARVGRFGPAEAVEVLVQLAEAIDHAHSHGVIHRDLKPANMILVERRGQGGETLKVLDFGVAKIIAPDDVESGEPRARSDVFGTPEYMAPEQVRGDGSEPRIDIYALGCIAFELVAGAPPFTGAWAKVLNDHVETPPPPLPGAPADLARVVERCLEKDPEARYATGAEIAAALRELPDREARRITRRFSRSSAFDDDAPTGVGAGVGAAPTIPVAPELGDDRRAAVRRAAEALLDGGCRDLRLVVALSDAAAARGRLAHIAAELEELSRRGDVIDQRGRQHEAALRFAIADMRFEQQEHPSELTGPIARLDARLGELAAETRAGLDELASRGVALAAERADCEAQLELAHLRLVHLMDELGAS